jgi:hypothetical protein
VIPRSESEVLAAYPELLEDDGGASLVTVARVLDAGYNLHRAPPAVRTMPRGRFPAHIRERLDELDHAQSASWVKPTRRWGIHTKFYAACLLVAAILLLAASHITDAGPKQGSITDLGKPTNSLPPRNPLSEFRHISTALKSHGLPEVLFVGTLVDDESAAERWPLVKALDQFGTLTGVAATSSASCNTASGTLVTAQNVHCLDPDKFPGKPTYDFSQAHYHSRYVTLVSKDLIDRGQHLHQILSRTEEALFDRYARFPGSSTWTDSVWQTALYSGGFTTQNGARGFPLLVIGSYQSSAAEVAIPGDLEPVVSSIPLAFPVIQQSLQRGKSVGDRRTGAPPTLVQDYNAEANVITALICHADGSKPTSVCGRAVIKTALKHVR